MTKIQIVIGDQLFSATLLETPTAETLKSALPFESIASTWGDEIYCEAPTNSALESDAKAEVQVGDLAYWPTMPAFCIFFGPTPVSSGDQPVAAAAVNVFGRLGYHRFG